MKAVEIARPGGPEVLRLVERPEPAIGPEEVLIAVAAAGVSRADVVQRQGRYPAPAGASDIPGLEVAGTIVAVGADAAGRQKNERVCALLTGGGYAEFAAVPAAQTLPIPDGWNFVEAATLPENAWTVYDNLFTRGRFCEGESLLVHGGTSGIGTTAIMFARAFGARFIAATAGTAQKCAACRALGAHLAIDYKHEDFVAAVLNATAGRGVDVVFDIVGGSYLPRDLEALAPDGRIVCIGTQAGSKVEVDLAQMMARRATITASSLRARTVRQKAEIARLLQERVWPLLPSRNPIQPVVDSTFPLENAADAHRRLEESAHVGKIVLTL